MRYNFNLFGKRMLSTW